MGQLISNLSLNKFFHIPNVTSISRSFVFNASQPNKEREMLILSGLIIGCLCGCLLWTLILFAGNLLQTTLKLGLFL